ncbi:hypothetical protein GCM10022279_10460 [Comamonas faecalis]|uniref:TIGR04438 family Trp-rich protein n=1 Tax=Comamonas faecalis TaxID=1387849 RepID=A0ABP7QX62_9BURK
MYALLLGIVFVLLKILAIGPVASWAWWWVLSPFALAFFWWMWADASGYTKRKEMEKTEQRRQARIDKHNKALGIEPRRPR